MRSKNALWVLAGGAGFLIACGQAELTTYSPVPAPTGTMDCTFTTGVLPIVRSTNPNFQCDSGSCHAGAAAPGNLNLSGTDDAVYASIRAAGSYGPAVSTTNIDMSLLLEAPLSGSAFGHPVKPFASTDDQGYRTFRCWIASGAPR